MQVDRERRGSVHKDEFDLLLMALGHHLSEKELDSCLNDMGVNPDGGLVPFDLFFDWWTDSMGMDAVRKKHGMLAASHK